MGDFLEAVKSVRTRRGEEAQDSQLEAVRTTDRKPRPTIYDESGHRNQQPSNINPSTLTPKSANEALRILRSKLDIDQLVATLSYLTSSKDVALESGAPFSLHDPGPLQAQIINTLLNSVVPDFWPNLTGSQRSRMITCLKSVAGLSAIIARLKLLSSQKTGLISNYANQRIPEVLELTDKLFAGDEVFLNVWHQLQTIASDKIKRDLAWKDFVNLTASGKIIACVAQAEDTPKGLQRRSWLAKGSEYAQWIGKNIAGLMLANPSLEDAPEASAQIFAKALNLGYPEQLLQGVFKKLLYADVKNATQGTLCTTLVNALPLHAKRTFAEHTLHWLSTLTTSTDTLLESPNQDVSAIAGFLCGMVQDELVKQHVLSSLSDSVLSSSITVTVRRACLAALILSEDDEMQALLDKLMSTFGNSLFINHTPIIQQDSIAQNLLLVAGHVHRQMPMALLMVARSSAHMQGVSNRLDSSNVRARWLGMVVGTAVSSLVDKEGSRMNFGTDEMESDEASWYLNLVKVEDRAGTLKDFNRLLQSRSETEKPTNRPKSTVKVDSGTTLNGKPVFGPPRPPAQTEVVGEKVTEIFDDDTEEEDDLKPYAKPDSDSEDSDEDATLVNRNKVRAPVYIRDLMSMLRDSENHDRFQLAIKHAAPLIRRKANFGAEVKDHASELAVILCNLQDPYSTEDFDELKLRALIAVLLSDVTLIAPWLCKQVFTADYSVAQRCIILSALGLGGRELAGLNNDDELNPTLTNVDFPSRRLPSHLHATYTLPSTSIQRLEAATKSMEHTLINPLALRAADHSTVHLNAVKIRTFSSRMDVERTKRKPAPNQLAKIFAQSFFFPLSNRYQQEVAAYSSASVFASVPIVLVTFIKTLALLLHASGAATVGLPEVLEEFWNLLLSLRVKASTDISVLQAVLFALLTLLEVSFDKRRIAEECPKQLMETERWVDLIFERTGGGGGSVSESGTEDEAKVRTLAAGVLVKTREVIDAYQKQLIGYEFD